MTKAQQITREYSVRDELETVTLVDAEDNVIGPCGKIAAHEDGQLHRAFSILITNPAGELQKKFDEFAETLLFFSDGFRKKRSQLNQRKWKRQFDNFLKLFVNDEYFKTFHYWI